MSAHNVLQEILKASFRSPDPGAGESLVVNRWGQVFAITTAAAEGRTLPAADKAGQLVIVYLEVDGGDLTLTTTNGPNVTLAAAGDTVAFISVDIAGVMHWKLIGTQSASQSSHIADPAAAAAITATSVTLSNMDDGSANNTLIAIGDTSAGNESGNIEQNFDKIGDEVNALVVDVGALKTAIDANNAAIDSILAAIEAAGITASS